ncbi:outer membrane lipoprotein chaperone LolA [Luteimonas aquatica]|uniref:outer membrane lipoprotein chaperone LolA n=1 Tax=Luteimonas aquatica TaxID=450364 RepID=UPI001F5616B0|nr:outer membrane lipoprotein chaperone LolA [Luteimonas aquatica]
MPAFRFAAALAALLFAAGASAGARDSLASFTKDLKGLDGQFSQQVFDTNGKLKESSSGRVALSAPRLFRWEYAKPYAQLIVADGKKVWVYDPDLSQVTVRPQGAEEQNSPLAALIDPGKLERDFDVAEAGAEGGLQWLVLTPKQDQDAGFQNARLGFGADGLARMQVVDSLGQRTEISFSGWKKNPAFAKDTFRYVPGKGVDVVGEG